MNWRGRTVEYSSDPAKSSAGRGFLRRLRSMRMRLLPDLLPGRGRSEGEGSVPFNGLGLAANNPTSQPSYRSR